MNHDEGAARNQVRKIAALTGQRAENVYKMRRLCCSESILYVLNEGFGGGLAPEVAVRLGSGFCHGMGGAGCACGALSGAEAILGLLLGPNQTGGLRKKAFDKVCREMHDRFRTRFGATCCRVLTKKRKEGKGASCQELTGGGAEIAAELLLTAKPELVGQVDLEFLERRDTKAGVMVQQLLGGRPSAN